MFPGRPDIARNRARQKVHAPHDLLIRRIYPIVSLISWNLSTIRPIDSHPVVSYRGLNVFLNYYSINFFSSKIYIYIYTKLRTDINFINKFFPSIRSAIPRIDRIFEIKKYRVLFNFQNLLSIVIQSIDLWSTYFRTIARSSFSIRNFIEMKYFEEFSFHIKESSTSLRYKFSIVSEDIKFSRRKIVLLSAKNFRVNSWNAAVGQEQLVEIVARMHTSSIRAFCNGDSKRGRRWAPH